jgi:hypothetical protein
MDHEYTDFCLNVYLLKERSRGGSVGTATDCGLDGRGSISSRSKKLDRLYGLRSFLSPWVKWPGYEADHTSRSNDEVNNGEAIPTPSRISSWHRDNFNLAFIV